QRNHAITNISEKLANLALIAVLPLLSPHWNIITKNYYSINDEEFDKNFKDFDELREFENFSIVMDYHLLQSL
ncbi:292_t:CDS:1, partial [Dentiscutata erythropus]